LREKEFPEMRREPVLLGLGLALGLALPAAAQSHRFGHAPAAPAAPAHPTHVSAGHLCPSCADELPRRVQVGTMTPDQASAMLAQGHGLPGMPGAEAPGYAAVGIGAPTMMATAEPAPIGVMRTAYAHPAALAAKPAAPAYIPPPPTPMGGPGVNKARMFGHMIGVPMPRLNALGRKAAERRRELHAAERYDGQLGGAATLPASAVYGRGH
jgi:hypothetical protein